MQEFTRTVPLHSIDLTELAEAVIRHSFRYSCEALEASLNEALSEGDTNTLTVSDIEERAFRLFTIEQSEELEKIRAQHAVVMQRCGIDIELRPGGLEFSGWSPAISVFHLSDAGAFISYVDGVKEHSSSITSKQENALLQLVEALLVQVRELYRVGDASDETAASFLGALPTLRHSLEALAVVQPAFLPAAAECKVLQWMVENHLAAEVLSCSRAGGFRMPSLTIKNDTLHGNFEGEVHLPPCASWYFSSEDAHVFSRKGRNLEQKLQNLVHFPKLREFSRSLAIRYQSELRRAKMNIIPDSSCLDEPHADLDFRVAIDEIYDRLSMMYSIE